MNSAVSLLTSNSYCGTGNGDCTQLGCYSYCGTALVGVLTRSATNCSCDNSRVC